MKVNFSLNNFHPNINNSPNFRALVQFKNGEAQDIDILLMANDGTIRKKEHKDGSKTYIETFSMYDGRKYKIKTNVPKDKEYKCLSSTLIHTTSGEKISYNGTYSLKEEWYLPYKTPKRNSKKAASTSQNQIQKNQDLISQAPPMHPSLNISV